MKQLAVISGKGGTGKTSITAALSVLSGSCVVADCDVDAADMYLLFEPDVRRAKGFFAGFAPVVDRDKCKKCGACIQMCHFEAINVCINVDPLSCEGCGMCSYVCPQNAVVMKTQQCGVMYVSDTRVGTLVHAKLTPAAENSGKLVTLVRNTALEIAERENKDWVIIDGSPGIGCPVIASLAGVDHALVVTEPTLSGLHDAERIVKTARCFGVDPFLVINKYDLNEDICTAIENYCRSESIKMLGKIPFDKKMVESMIEKKTIVEYAPHAEVSFFINGLWEKIKNGG